MAFSAEDRVLIEVMRQKKGNGARLGHVGEAAGASVCTATGIITLIS